jgi:Ca2+-binding EF-hand superfamily protein
MSDQALRRQFEDSLEDFLRGGNVEAARALFTAFDVNHNDRISLDEVLQYLGQRYGEPSAARRAEVEGQFKASDANEDGALDFVEFQAFLRAAS